MSAASNSLNVTNTESLTNKEPSVNSNMKGKRLSSGASTSEQSTSKKTKNESSPDPDSISDSPVASTVALRRKRNRRIWTLVTGDGECFRCNECKKTIKCCSPTNITRHYMNNHPEIFKSMDGTNESLKQEDESKTEENADNLVRNRSNTVESSGSTASGNKGYNCGKVDWSSPAVRKVLEMIAARELTEKMGTDMIAYKTGCQLSQSTVRKRVHSLLEAKIDSCIDESSGRQVDEITADQQGISKYGSYPPAKKSDSQSAQKGEDIKKETVTYLALSNDGGSTKVLKVEGRKIHGEEEIEKPGTTSAAVIPRQVRSLRLSRSSIVIPEKDDPSKVRIYRCSAYGRGKQGATSYYRCSRCDSLASNKLKNSGATATSADRAKRYYAHIKTRNGQIIGNAYPEHLPECKPVPKEVQQLQEIDRACRARIQAGTLTPEAARKLGALVAQRNRELKRQIQDDDTFPDKWKSLPKKYSRLCHQAERLRKRKTKQLMRMMNNEQGDGETEEDQSELAHVAEVMSVRFKHPPLIIFEPDGQSARIYRINGKSDRLDIIYYRCSKCDVLCRRHKKLGTNEGMIRATVKVEGFEILENMYPAHHDECEVLTLEMIKNLAESFDRFYFAKDYEPIVHDSAKTDLRFADGTLISKNQLPVFGRAEDEHVVEDNESIDINNIAGNEEVNNEWDTIATEDLMNIESGEHEGPVNNSCHRYYEANIALRRDMMRCLEEMRALRNEMRSMLDEGKLQYIEMGDDVHYEEIIVDEND